jgi:FkbM family methyltransferase
VTANGSALHLRPRPGAVDRFLVSWYRRKWRGFYFLFALRARMSGSRGLVVRSSFGPFYRVSPDEDVGGIIIHHGFYESEVFLALRPYLGSSAVFWDIGANIGLHAVAAKFVSPETEVHAFEPVPELVSRVAGNAVLNGVEIQIHSLALSNRTREADLYVPVGPSSGRATLQPVSGASSVVRVSCLRADELINAGVVQPPTVLKLDVEGAECEVLEGFGKYLGSPELHAVVFEGAPHLETAAADDALASRLRQAGFQLKCLERQEPTHHLLENYLAYRP